MKTAKDKSNLGSRRVVFTPLILVRCHYRLGGLIILFINGDFSLNAEMIH